MDSFRLSTLSSLRNSEPIAALRCFFLSQEFIITGQDLKDITLGIRLTDEMSKLLGECDRSGTEMEISRYRINYILRVSTDQLKDRQINTPKKAFSSGTFQDEFVLSSDGKK